MLGANALADCIPFFMIVEKFPFIEKNVKVGCHSCFDFFRKYMIEGNMSHYSVEQTEECLKRLKRKTGSKIVIKVKNSLCQMNGQKQCEKKAIILQGIVVFFIRQNLWNFYFLFYYSLSNSQL